MPAPPLARLRWYAHRAAAMPPAEWLHRTRTAVRVAAERLEASRAGDGDGPAIAAPDAGWPRPPGAVALVTADDVAYVRGLPGVVDAARRVADAALEGRVELLRHRDVVLPDDPDWHLDLSTGHRYPEVHWSRVEYRAAAGDPKWLWELGRHLHVAHLARAWRLTGDDRYARHAARHLDGFLRQCPPGVGIQWRVGLELGLRLVAWAWIVEFLRDSPAATPGRGEALLRSAEAHMAWLERYPSLHSSANNHRLGELVGLVVGGLAFPQLPRAGERAERALDGLVAELGRQVHPDGVNAEAAVGYHAFVLELCLPAIAALRRAGRAVPEGLAAPVRAMADVLGTLASDGGTLPAIGDDDDAVAVQLTSIRDDDRERLLSRLRSAAALVGAERARVAPGMDEQTAWLCGPGAEVVRPVRRLPGSAAFPAGGLVVLRRRDTPAGELRAVLRAGPFGLGPIFAHAHADQLTLCVAAGGEEAIVDAGTFTYYGERRWRDYARSTAAHSTVTLDDRDQVTPAGAFLWRRHVEGVLQRVSLDGDVQSVTAHHDGYAPVRHVRTVTLSREGLEVVDRLSGGAGGDEHLVGLRWHLAPGDVETDGPRARWRGRAAALRIEVAGAGPVRVVRGCASRPMGFRSTAMNVWEPSPTLVAEARLRLPAVVTTHIAVDGGATAIPSDAVDGGATAIPSDAVDGGAAAAPGGTPAEAP